MSAAHTCPRCGTPLPSEGWEGLCPKCVVRLSLQAPPDIEGADHVSDRGCPQRQYTEIAASEPPPESPSTTELASGGDTDAPKSRDFGDYELLEEIARGGMGVVYRARQKSLDRLVALKMLLFEPTAGADLIRRFRVEAIAAGSLHHPNIVAIHEVGIHEEQHFLVMDYVDGPNLAKFARVRPLSAKRAAGYVKTVAEAIHYAHERGILHRDLKPSNVLVDANNQPHVTDFGLAKRLASDSQLSTHQSQLTLSGQVLGTPNYMPPEQASAQWGKVSRRSDVYGLGAILYHLLTSRPPFQGENITDTLQQLLNDEPVSPRLLTPSVPRDLETICLKCLEKDPERRYAKAQEVANELKSFLNDEPILARPVSSREKMWRWCRRKPLLATLSATVLLLLVSVATVSTISAWRVGIARDAERRERYRAEENLYAADMLLAQQAIKAGNLGRARELLNRNRPETGELDLRHWEWRYLWGQCRSDALLTLAQHGYPVFAISLSPDSKLLASGGAQGQVKIWDVAARQLVTTLSSNGQPALAVFSPRGDRLAATAQKGIVKVWEVNSWIGVMQLRHDGAVRSISFSSDGRLLAVLARDQGLTVSVSLWSLENTNRLANFQAGGYVSGHHGMVVISPNNQWLAVGESDGQIRVFDLATLGKRFNFAGPAEGITALAFSPDSYVLASGSGFDDPSIRLWSLATGTEVGRLEGHDAWVTSLAFSSSGKLLASASADHTIRLWDTAEWKGVAILRGHQHEVWAVAFLPDGKTLASGAKDGEISLWSVHPKTQATGLVTLPGVIRDASFAADSRFLATQNGDGSISLWDVARLEQTRRLTALGTDNVGVLFSPKRGLLAVGHRDGAVKLLDLARPHEVKELRSSLSAAIRPVSFTMDGKFLFGSAVETLVAPWTSVRGYALWAVETGKEMASWPAAPETTRIALSPDGKFAVVGGEDGTVRFWNIATGPEQMQIAAHNHALSSIGFARNGKLFATGSTQGDAMLWDLASRTPIANLRGHLLGVHAVAFSPDGRRLATASGGREAVKLWDVATRQEVATLEGQGSVFQTVQFSSDSNTLMAINLLGTLHLWRAASFTEIDAMEKAGD